tara:strand:+ start:465 stop:1379 length:915 start_codon:yes stop_codon:yes gene_type:complete
VREHPTLASWAALFRAGNSVTGIFGVVLGSILASQGLPSGDFALITALHCLSVMTFMFSWNALNDYMDIEIDRINRPDRPLPSGQISEVAAKRGIQSTAILSTSFLIAAAFVSHRGEIGIDGWLPSLGIWIIALVLLFNYESPSKLSFRMKDSGLPGNLAISMSVGLVIIFGAASVSDPLDNRAWAVFVVGFLYNFSREIVKDIEDIGGDKGRETYAMRAGEERARELAAIVLILALAAMLAPFSPLLEIFTDWHVVFVIPAVVTLMMVKPKLLASEDHRAQKLIKNSMQLCLIAFLAISLIPS